MALSFCCCIVLKSWNCAPPPHWNPICSLHFLFFLTAGGPQVHEEHALCQETQQEGLEGGTEGSQGEISILAATSVNFFFHHCNKAMLCWQTNIRLFFLLFLIIFAWLGVWDLNVMLVVTGVSALQNVMSIYICFSGHPAAESNSLKQKMQSFT